MENKITFHLLFFLSDLKVTSSYNTPWKYYSQYPYQKTKKRLNTRLKDLPHHGCFRNYTHCSMILKLQSVEFVTSLLTADSMCTASHSYKYRRAEHPGIIRNPAYFSPTLVRSNGEIGKILHSKNALAASEFTILNMLT